MQQFEIHGKNISGGLGINYIGTDSLFRYYHSILLMFLANYEERPSF